MSRDSRASETDWQPRPTPEFETLRGHSGAFYLIRVPSAASAFLSHRLTRRSTMSNITSKPDDRSVLNLPNGRHMSLLRHAPGAKTARRQLPSLRSFFVGAADRKSTRLNSSHPSISYAVFCLKKKK